jgi:hypothetical protein
MQTPVRAVSFATGSEVARMATSSELGRIRRRHQGQSKPWQMQHYEHTPHTKEIYRKGRAEYRNTIITKDAWPTQELRARYGKQAWEDVIKQNPELYANCKYSSLR